MKKRFKLIIPSIVTLFGLSIIFNLTCSISNVETKAISSENSSYISTDFLSIKEQNISYQKTYLLNEINDSKAVAKQYAQKFNNDISNVCTNTSPGEQRINELKLEWETLASDFSELESNAKIILKEAKVDSDDPDLATFAGKYDYVYGKYSEEGLEDFAQRNPAKITNSSGINKMTEMVDIDQKIMIVIIFIAFLALTSSHFIIKKRKSK